MNVIALRCAIVLVVLLDAASLWAIPAGPAKPPRGAALAQEDIRSETWHRELGAAIREAQTDRKPILVLFEADFCLWCRKLQKEMNDRGVQDELNRWTLVKLDLDASQVDAVRLGVTAVPALRVLDSAGQAVARHDGFLTAAGLRSWLSKQYGVATTARGGVPWSPQPPDAATLTKLIEQLGQRDPMLREAAIRRLLAHPQACRPAVVRVLADGSLSTRLSAMELLRGWRAPVEGLDPWRPETLTSARLKDLDRWTATPLAPIKPAPLDATQQVATQQEIERMLKASPGEADAECERLARLGPALLPLVTERLRKATADQDRQRLLMLRYRLAAGESLVLAWPGGLARLAAVDVKLRRKAAEDLVIRASGADQGLLLEVFGDPDPLVREIALRGIQKIGGPEASAALVKLLDDPEPNVRAAVLKQLAESPSAGMVPHVVKYVAKEKDPDLVVHAIRVLKSTSSKPVQECLVTLLTHPQWQVRAEATESLSKLVSNRGSYRSGRSHSEESKVEVYAALLRQLDDAEGFVVAKAVEALTDANLEVVVEPMIAAAGKHPELAGKIIQALARGSKTALKAAPHFRKFLKDSRPQTRAAAIAGLVLALPQACQDEVLAALRDPAQEVRVAAAKGIWTLLNQRREKTLRESLKVEPGVVVSGWTTLVEGMGKLLGQGTAPAGKPAETKDTRGEDWDKWLARHYAGGERPKWTEDAIAPLRKMLDQRDEEAWTVAAQTLVPLGKAEAILPRLLAAARSRPALISRVSEVLPWLPWAQRQKAFDQLFGAGGSESEQAHVLVKFAEVPDHRAAARLWSILAQPKLSVPAAASLVESLPKIYVGEHYNREKWPKAALRDLVAAASARLASGSDLQRLTALVILANAVPGEAAAPAQKIDEDQSLSRELRRDAFHVRLLVESTRNRRKLAVTAIQAGDRERGKLALATLADDPSAAVREVFYVTTYTWSSSDDQRQDPQPPAGLTAEHIRPYLNDSNLDTAAHAGYLLALLGERDGLEPVLRRWREHGQRYDRSRRPVYRAIAALDDSAQLPVLKKIYEQLESYEVSEFYWAIRPMTGPAMLEFRKQIRDEVGVSNLR